MTLLAPLGTPKRTLHGWRCIVPRWTFCLLLVFAGLAVELPLVCQSLGDEADKRALLWKRMKDALVSPTGERYFEQAAKDALVPTLEGTLVSSSPKEHPTEFLVAMPGSDVPEVTLKLKGNLAKTLPPGTPVSFNGLLRDFKPEPFMLTFEVETVNRATVPGKKTRTQPPNKKQK